MRHTEALSSTHTSQAANKTLRNTYGLLSLTLLFSAFTAGVSMTMNFASMNIFVLLIGFYGLLFLTHKFKNSPLGILCVFALTGFMGLTLGPILSAYMSLPGGGSLIMTALGITGLSFLGLSAYALISKRDFSFLNGFITVGFFVLLFAVIAGIFIKMPALQIFISAGFALFSGAVILLQTNQIVRGGETNYILATVNLYVSLYNMFLSILSLLGMARDD
jgi:modulator of FtsH protease